MLENVTSAPWSLVQPLQPAQEAGSKHAQRGQSSRATPALSKRCSCNGCYTHTRTRKHLSTLGNASPQKVEEGF